MTYFETISSKKILIMKSFLRSPYFYFSSFFLETGKEGERFIERNVNVRERL